MRIEPEYSFARACLCPLLFFFGAIFAETITITSYEGARHEFKGFGASTTRGRETEIARVLFSPEEADFRVIRLWTYLSFSSQDFLDRYDAFVGEIRSLQPDAIVLAAPCGQDYDPVADVHGYASHYAQIYRDARDQGLRVDVTGIMNEPDDRGRLSVDLAAEMVKAFREELDNRGLDDVAIIAPENANVNAEMLDWVSTIQRDGDASSGLGGWAYHNYNMSVNPIYRDMIDGDGRDVWNTESCVDQSSTIEFGDNSGQISSKTATRILADLNICTSYWLYFMTSGGDDGTGLVARDGAAKLQYVVMKHIGKTFDVGARFRYCESDKALPQTHMSWEFGRKPAITCAVARNPGGTWGIAVCNGTGIQEDTEISSFYPAATYDVTVNVEELRNAGEIDFALTRTNTSVRLADEGLVTMSGGSVTLTLESRDLAALRSVEPVGLRPRAQGDGMQQWNVRRTSQGPAVRLGAGQAGSAILRAIDGRTVRIPLLTMEVSGLRPLSVPSGVYLLETVTAGRTQRCRFAVMR